MPKPPKKISGPRELTELKELESLTKAEFEKLPDRSPPTGAKNIVTTLLGRLGADEAKMFELDGRQYLGLRRHVSIKGDKALLKARLQSYTDSPKGRIYKVAVARA